METQLRDREDTQLERVVRRLVDAVDPARVILFGSRAKGTATEHSDYDLCVVAVRDVLDEDAAVDQHPRTHAQGHDASCSTLNL